MGAYVYEVGGNSQLLTTASKPELVRALNEYLEAPENECRCTYCKPTNPAMIEVLDRNGNTIQTLH